MDVYAQLKDRVNAIIAAYKEAMSDGDLQFVEGIKLIFFVGSSFMELAKSIAPDIADKEAVKKAVAMAVHAFYTEVIEPLGVPGVPKFIGNMLGRAVEGAIDPIVDQIIDFLYDFAGGLAGPQPTPIPNIVGSLPPLYRLDVVQFSQLSPTEVLKLCTKG